MFRVADFAKSSIKSERISYDEDPPNEDEKFSPPIQASGEYTTGSLEDGYYDDIDMKFGIGGSKKPFSQQHGDCKSSFGSGNDDRKTLGFPSGFSVSFGQVEKQRKGEKRTFYCEMCLVELSSLDTMKSHVSGVKHMKKQLALSNDRDDKVRRGLMTEKEAMMSEPRVKPIPNPESVKKKVPIRLQEKIKETMDPVVGLRYVKEFIAVSDAEMEPHYECELCGAMGQSNGMFSHLMGHKHRQRFMEDISGDDPRMLNLTQAELLYKAKEFNENNHKLSDLIRTTRSDEKYPWPPGKAPWTVERGGTGIPPDGARDNFGKNRHGAQAEQERPRCAECGSSLMDGLMKLPAPDMVRAPSSREEAEKMMEVGRKLITMAMEGSGVEKRDRQVIQASMAAVLAKIDENLANPRRS
eukprot:GFUD01039377.1.p1 GENE.GFUD01039377.1~~GFUD01039377.1.p1  ORF type:complete len:411 (-),score=128.55 GFUD01039377.1:42-1274(-)